MFPIVRIDSSMAEALEPLGTKRKFWFTGAKGRRLLFKAEERGTGEDWAEKVSCELAGLLGLPHVHYELAFDTAARTPGVICESCVVAPTVLLMGNQLMLDRDPDYPANSGRRYRVSEHTLAAVARTLQSLSLPGPPWCGALPEGVTTAVEVFAGYVMLDAWIANQDRHHENWAGMRTAGTTALAPTFDHGAALARNLSDEERAERLNSRDQGRRMPAFARRARSAFYAEPGDASAMSTHAAWQAFSRFAPAASTIWVDRLRRIDVGQVRDLLREVPPDRLSAIGRAFTAELLAENRRRIVEEFEP
ncbi:MAG: hypothetical protein R3F15_21805 [Lysobacterales bacterium]